MALAFSPSPRVVRLSLIVVVILTTLYLITVSHRQLSPGIKKSIPFQSVSGGMVGAKDIAKGFPYFNENNGKDDYVPQIANPSTPQSRYFQELETVPKQFDEFHSTVNRIQKPANLRHSEYFRDDPRRGKKASTTKIYDPYPDYHSSAWKSAHSAEFQTCMGPRGVFLNESADDAVFAYKGAPKDFPEPSFGTHAVLDMDSDVCFDRYSRYGPYGFGDDENSVRDWTKPQHVDWQSVDWGTLQRECVQKNSARYKKRPSGGSEYRTAFLIRSYTGKQYSENDKQNIRSMVMELSLMSGGEYEVILFVHSKDDSISLDDKDAYQKILEENVPKEFWSITELWNMATAKKPYTKFDQSITNVHTSQWMSLQSFALTHPDFEYFWNWEVDARYTGHLYEFAQRVADFGRRQPRKGIWERSGRFWIPSLHGDYDDEFRHYVQRREDQFVWSAYPVPDTTPLGPKPPVSSPAEDDYAWGVGEEADYISLLPIFDPQNTNWVIRDHLWGYKDGPNTPRRTTIITQSRISRNLLSIMHAENFDGRHLASEMFPQTVALHHGLKAVYSPHPIYSERKWQPHRLDRWFNSGPQGQSGSGPDSPFGWGLEGRFETLSWYYKCNLPGLLYWNFLGWKHGSLGGKDWEGSNGRVCLPPMLFHPIKQVDEDANTFVEFPRR